MFLKEIPRSNISDNPINGFSLADTPHFSHGRFMKEERFPYFRKLSVIVES